MSEAETEPAAGGARQPTTRVSRVGWLVTHDGKEIGRSASKAEAEAIGHAWAQGVANRTKVRAILEIEDGEGDVEHTRKIKPEPQG